MPACPFSQTGFGLLGVVVLVKFVLDQSSRSARDKSPLQILQERNARGEINREEYEQTKRDLEPPA